MDTFLLLLILVVLVAILFVVIQIWKVLTRRMEQHQMAGFRPVMASHDIPPHSEDAFASLCTVIWSWIDGRWVVHEIRGGNKPGNPPQDPGAYEGETRKMMNQ